MLLTITVSFPHPHSLCNLPSQISLPNIMLKSFFKVLSKIKFLTSYSLKPGLCLSENDPTTYSVFKDLRSGVNLGCSVSSHFISKPLVNPIRLTYKIYPNSKYFHHHHPSLSQLHFLPAAAAAKSLQSCPTLCDPIDGSPPGSPVPGILA